MIGCLGDTVSAKDFDIGGTKNKAGSATSNRGLRPEHEEGTAIRTITKLLREAFKGAGIEKASKKRARELHPSGFPYCALKHGYNKLAGNQETRTVGFESDYYTQVGTLVHSIMQRWLSTTTKLYGTWYCAKCEKTTKQYAPCNKYCTPVYQEIGGTTDTYIDWHTDGLMLLDDDFWVVDFKTSSVHAISEHKRGGGKFPYAKNVTQIKSYCALVQNKYKDKTIGGITNGKQVKIKGWILIYLARDSPTRNFAIVAQEITQKEIRNQTRQMKKYVENFQVVLKTKTVESLIKNVIPIKACDSKEYYDKNYADPYDKCPVSKHCFEEKKLIKFLKKELE